ncbi:MAG: multicopper oxidase domain-containing protein, partial [Nitrospiraceae bacterium]|nr:multicopper oxidase domain-containing protein [Nitrospiraceae bacterium]
VRMNPGEITRVIMRFALPKITGPGPLYPLITTGANSAKDIINGNPPPSPRTGGSEYVWHCHILEHEEHDMMRPLVVY